MIFKGIWTRVIVAGMVQGIGLVEVRGKDEGAERVIVDRVVAYVNAHAVTLGDIEMAVMPQARQIRAQAQGPSMQEQLEALYRQGLEYLIESQLVLQAYEDQEGRIPEWAIDQHMDDIVRSEFQGDRNALVRALAQDRMTPSQWREDVRRSMIVSSMRAAAIGQGVVVSPGDVRTYYEANRDDFKVADQVRLGVIELPLDQKALADELRSRLQADDVFEGLAREFSQGSRREAGGDWGWLNLNDLRPELADLVRSLEAGAVGSPLTVGDRVYLVKVTERKSGGTVIPFADAQKDIEHRLRNRQAEKQYREWMARLKAQSYIRVLDVL